MVDLDSIRARLEALEPGTWKLDRAVTEGPGFRFNVQHVGSGGRITHLVNVRGPVAWFIANARQDVPALVDEVESLRADLEKARAKLKKFGLYAG